jgi:predicted MPP superfamily phosphohydrolase
MRFHSIHFFIAALVVPANLLLCALQIGWLRRRKPWPRGLALAICLWTLAMMVLFFLQLFAPAEWRPFLRHWLYFPFAVEMAWNLLMVQVLALIAVVVSLVLWWKRPVKALDTPPSPADLSRRKFVYLLACGAAPATALGMGVHGSISRFDLRLRRFDIPIANLPPELEGFTIAHVSDLHSGVFCGPHRLGLAVTAANDLKPDLVAITGDLINNNMTEFPDALAAMQKLRSKYGTFICEGNHDIIPGRGLVKEACWDNHLPLLWYQRTTIQVGNRRIYLAGLPWMMRGYQNHADLVTGLYPEREEGDVRILLAHHPHIFDSAQSADLVLSGHTHGGQIMVGDVGLGPLFFKYWSGRYQRNNTTMIVSNGCGDWFPCRVGAPAEIGLLRLTAKT